MRKAVVISLVFHAVVTIIAFQWVSFREVRYVPREVYDVTLVTPSFAEPAARVSKPVTAPEPEPVAPPVEEEKKEEEMPPPPEEKKKPPVQKPVEKKAESREVPTSEIRKTDPSVTPGTADAGAGQATTTGQMSFDSGDFPFAHYISRLRQKIAASWRAPAGANEERMARVYFRVHRDGSVSDVSVEESSGVFMFDQSCQRAVLAASPMPPLPREFKDEYLGVHFSFVYRESE